MRIGLLLMVLLVGCKSSSSHVRVDDKQNDGRNFDHLNWIDCKLKLLPKKRPTSSKLATDAKLVFDKIAGRQKPAYKCKSCHGGSDIFALSTVLDIVETAERISDTTKKGKVDSRMAEKFFYALGRMPPKIENDTKPRDPGVSKADVKILQKWVKASTPVCKVWVPKS